MRGTGACLYVRHRCLLVMHTCFLVMHTCFLVRHTCLLVRHRCLLERHFCIFVRLMNKYTVSKAVHRLREKPKKEHQDVNKFTEFTQKYTEFRYENLQLGPSFENIYMNNVYYEQGTRNGSNLVIRWPGPNWLTGLTPILDCRICFSINEPKCVRQFWGMGIFPR